MLFRFVHAADIHLDSPLRSLALRDPELGELIGNATRQAFVRIVDLCLVERVDALLLAGDLYDGDQTSMKTARFLAEQMHRLDQAGVRVFIIRGNHDALSRITRELVLPPNVLVFGGRAEAVALDHALPVVMHGLSFAQPHAPESLLGRYRPPVEGAVNIGLMHTSLNGSPDHDPYAPCSISDLQASGVAYWALGHIHARSVTATERCTIVMPGNPQGRDINEAGARSATLVTVDDDRRIRIEERVTALAQFERVAVELDGIADWAGMATLISHRLEAARAAATCEHLVARLVFTGRTPLAWQLRRDAELALEEAAHRARQAGQCWIEKIEIRCTAPDERATATADPVIELRRLVGDEIAGTEGFAAALAALGKDLTRQLPPELRDLFGRDEAAFHATLRELAQEGIEDVLASLRPAADEAA